MMLALCCFWMTTTPFLSFMVYFGDNYYMICRIIGSRDRTRFLPSGMLASGGKRLTNK
jgi:hypothetical protein